MPQYRRDKNIRMIDKLQDMEADRREGMYSSRMDSIKGFIVYMARTYRDTNPYLQCLNTTLDIWRPFRDKEG